MKGHKWVMLPIQGIVFPTCYIVGKTKYVSHAKVLLCSEATAGVNFPGSNERAFQISFPGQH